MGGGFFESVLADYFIKKIIKIFIFVFGGFWVLPMYLQSQGMIKVELHTDKIQRLADGIKNSKATNTTNVFPTNNNHLLILGKLDIPLAGGIAS